MALFFLETITKIFDLNQFYNLDKFLKMSFVFGLVIPFSKSSIINILFFLLYSKVCKANRTFFFI